MINDEGAVGKNIAQISYHIIVVLLSAALALSVPLLASTLAGSLLSAWAYIENEKIFLVALEILTAVMLIFFFNAARSGWKNRMIAKMARGIGLVLASPSRGIFAQRRIKKLKKKWSFARELFIIGSTGCRTFAEPDGDLHEAVGNCREAKIMLLDPFGEGAITRARSIPDAEITPEVLRGQIMKSISFLKGLRTAQKQVRLKLYPDLPLLKLAIIGDYAFLRHYHTGMNVRHMPEYVFRNEPNHGGLYVPLHRYFLSRWQDPAIPEYDLDTDELVHRDRSGAEVRRVPFGDNIPMPLSGTEQEAYADILPGYTGAAGPGAGSSLPDGPNIHRAVQTASLSRQELPAAG